MLQANRSGLNLSRGIFGGDVAMARVGGCGQLPRGTQKPARNWRRGAASGRFKSNTFVRAPGPSRGVHHFLRRAARRLNPSPGFSRLRQLTSYMQCSLRCTVFARYFWGRFPTTSKPMSQSLPVHFRRHNHETDPRPASRPLSVLHVLAGNPRQQLFTANSGACWVGVGIQNKRQ